MPEKNPPTVADLLATRERRLAEEAQREGRERAARDAWNTAAKTQIDDVAKPVFDDIAAQLRAAGFEADVQVGDAMFKNNPVIRLEVKMGSPSAHFFSLTGGITEGSYIVSTHVWGEHKDPAPRREEARRVGALEFTPEVIRVELLAFIERVVSTH